jgi:hypothetical protein
MLDEGERNGLDCGCVDIAMKNVIMELVRVVMEVEGGGYGGWSDGFVVVRGGYEGC